jgi:hypothetical protein
MALHFFSVSLSCGTVWNPDAILFNHALEWRILAEKRLAIAVGQGQRRGEVRLRLDGNGDPISIEVDARPRQVGRASKLTPGSAAVADTNGTAAGEFHIWRRLGGVSTANPLSIGAHVLKLGRSLKNTDQAVGFF